MNEVENSDSAAALLPAWLTLGSLDLPSREEVQPWFDAVCGFWDDPACCKAASGLARAAAEDRYHERVMRKRYREYFELLGSGGDLFE